MTVRSVKSTVQKQRPYPSVMESGISNYQMELINEGVLKMIKYSWHGITHLDGGDMLRS